jgi:hypothetical protein
MLLGLNRGLEERWKGVLDEVSIFPCGFLREEIFPLDQPLSDIVARDLAHLKYQGRAGLDCPILVHQWKVRIWNCFGSQVKLELTDVEDRVDLHAGWKLQMICHIANTM